MALTLLWLLKTIQLNDEDLCGYFCMKNKKEKLFDAVQMVRDIRDALYQQTTDPNFDPKEFNRIKKKWTHRLEQQEKTTTHNIGFA